MRELKTADFQFHLRMSDRHGSRANCTSTSATVGETEAGRTVSVLNLSKIGVDAWRFRDGFAKGWRQGGWWGEISGEGPLEGFVLRLDRSPYKA
jgi:hypothetical protein